MNHIDNYKLMVMILCCGLSFGCSKMDDPIKDYIKGGEIIYATRTDSLKSFSGNERIKLTWLLPANHSAVKAVVYWEGKNKSRELPLVKTPNQTYEFVLEDMPEASYLFSVQTFDKENHSSVKSEVTAVAYGERYRHGLLNRVYIKLSKLNGNLLMNWGLAEKSATGVTVEYTDLNGQVQTVTTASTLNETIVPLPDFKKPIRYRTIFNPGLKSIDDFLSDWSNGVDVSKL